MGIIAVETQFSVCFVMQIGEPDSNLTLLKSFLGPIHHCTLSSLAILYSYVAVIPVLIMIGF